MSYGNIILRAAQLSLVLVILSLSADLIQGQTYGSPPAISIFALFSSIWSFLIASLGLLAIFVPLLPAHVALFCDALASLLLLIAGTALAAALGQPHSCASPNLSPNTYVTNNAVINGGKAFRMGAWVVNLYEPFEARCRAAQAVTVLMFLAAVTFTGSVVVDWALLKRRESRRTDELVEMKKAAVSEEDLIGGEGRSWL